jgi:hypothetical protein
LRMSFVGKPVPTFPGHALISGIPEFVRKREVRSHRAENESQSHRRNA